MGRLAQTLGLTFSKPCPAIVRENKTTETRCSCKIASCQKKYRAPQACQAARNKLARQEAARGIRNKEVMCPPTSDRQANYSFSFRSCPTKVNPVRGWRFAPACCDAQSVIWRGQGCVMPLYRLAWAALNLHRHSELHQPSASAVPMKTVHASLSFGVRRSKWCGLTSRSTGHFAAGRVWASKA